MKEQEKEINKNWAGGIGLVGLGTFFLLAQNGLMPQLSEPPMFFMLFALGFIAWGIIANESGLFVPGGIFTGLALGITLLESSLTQYVYEDGGLFMIGFSLGWVSISLLTAVFHHKLVFWPFIPASIIGFIGFAVSLGGLWITLLEFAGKSWPLILVGLGIYMLWENSQSNSAEKTPKF